MQPSVRSNCSFQPCHGMSVPFVSIVCVMDGGPDEMGTSTLRRPEEGRLVAAVRRLGRLPLMLAVAAVVASALLCLPVIWRLNTDEGLWFAIVGYVLTPFVASAMLIWSRRDDLRLSAEVEYARADARRTLRTLTIVVALGYIPALVHIWYIASFVGSAVS